MPIQDLTKAVLLVIDCQNDFCPGGALAVPEGDAVMPVINDLAPRFPLVVATKDWHPQGHVSFASRHAHGEAGRTITIDGIDQVLWPDHCVQATGGAEFHPDLDTRYVNLVLHKGTHKDLDSYSAFFENDRKTPTGLEFYLRGLGFESVVVVGLAEDVCVFFSARDAKNIGFDTYVVGDATRGVDTPSGSLVAAREEMAKLGIRYLAPEDLG